MEDARSLIVNADDFGLSPGVNRGIIQAHERGILTSASLMVRWGAAAEAAAYARRTAPLGIGLHFDLGEWQFAGIEWRPLYEVLPGGSGSADVERELRAQLDAFRNLMGRDPDHLDSHQHAHCREPALSAATRLAEELGVPLRHCTGGIRYCGDFYGQTGDGQPLPQSLTVDHLIDVVRSTPPGCSELCCHPAADVDDLPTATIYRDERLRELRALCDPAVRRAVSELGITLRTFSARTEIR